MENGLQTAMGMENGLAYWQRRWDVGQRCLAMGLYVPARRELEAAETAAFQRRDAASLERIYLSLLEACRQARLQACEGFILIGEPRRGSAGLVKFPRAADAAVLVAAGTRGYEQAVRFARGGRSGGKPKEALLLLVKGGEVRLCSPGWPRYCGGVTVEFTAGAGRVLLPKDMDGCVALLPAPGLYAPGTAGHGMARESLLLAWEWLALKWQSCHRVRAQPWEELAWLRAARQVDGACEPVMMRMMELCRVLAGS